MTTKPYQLPSHLASKSFCIPASPSRPGGMRGAFKFTSGRNEVRTKDGCFLRSPRPCLWKEWKGKEEERKGRNSRERKRKGRNLIPSGAFAYSTGLAPDSISPPPKSHNLGCQNWVPKWAPKMLLLLSSLAYPSMVIKNLLWC